MRDNGRADVITQAGWLTLDQAARALGVSVHAVRRRARAGEMSARQVLTDRGPSWRVLLKTDPDEVAYAQDVVDLEDIRAAHRLAPPPASPDGPATPEMDLYIAGLERVPWRLLGYAASAWLIAMTVGEVADRGRWWVYWLLSRATYTVIPPGGWQ